MKRCAAIMGAVVLFLSFAGCGPGTAAPSSSGKQPSSLNTDSNDTADPGGPDETGDNAAAGTGAASDTGQGAVSRTTSGAKRDPTVHSGVRTQTTRRGSTTTTSSRVPAPGVTPVSMALSGMPTSFAYGAAFCTRGLLVRVTYSDGITRTIQGNGYTVDSSAYKATVAGEYTIKVKLKDTNMTKKYTVTVRGRTDWSDDGVLKILTIGNSFSDDSMEYVYQIAQACGIEKVRLGNLYIGGCPLSTHVMNAENDSAAYDYRTNSSGAWSTRGAYKMSDAIRSENWDFISLQQASGSSGMADTYSDLAYLADYVRGLANTDAKLVWNMTWAYQQNSNHGEFPKYNRDQTTMYRAIVSAVKTTVVTDSRIAMVIPTGTAIQNARTSYVGDTLTRDGYHLTIDFGRYIAGLTFVHKLCGVPIDNIRYAPAGVDEDARKIAVESVNNAVATPFEVTRSAYTAKPSFDPTGYTRLDLGLTPFGYWNATEATYDRINTTSSISANYYATKRFTREELPVGSVILIESGWQYRPEAWKTDGVQASSSRPGNTSTSKVVVTAAWWGDYRYRAFNISKQGTPSLKGSEAAAAAALTIYIPKT